MTDAARPGRPPHPHAGLGRHVRDRRDPRSRRAPDRPRRHRHHRPRADRRRARRPGDRPRPRPARRGHRRRGGLDARRPPARAVPRGARSGRSARCARRSPRSTSRAGSRSRPTRSCRIRSAPRAGVLRRLISDRDPRVRPDAIEAFNPTTLGRPWHARVVRFAAEHGLATRRQQRRPRGGGDRHRLDDVPGADRRRPPVGDPRAARRTTTAASTARARSGRSAASSGSTAATRGRSSGPRSGATAPGATSAIPAAATARRGSRRSGRRSRPARSADREDRARLAVRLPAARRRDPARPVPVREPPAARPRRPDPDEQPRPPARVRGRHHPDRQGLLAAGQRLGRDDHAVAPVRVAGPGDVLEREQFDLLHFHEPFVPFLSTILLRLSTSVNIATFHAYGGFSPSYEFGSKVMKGEAARLHGRIAVSGAAQALHRPLLSGRVQGDPERRRRRPVPAGRPDRALAGRHAEHPVRRPARAAEGPPRAAQGLPDPAQDRLRLPAPRRRDGPARSARPGATSRRGASRASSSSAACQRRGEGPALPDGRRLRLARDRRRIVRDRPARGDGGRHADRRLRHPRLQGRRPARPRGAARPAPGAEGDRRGRRAPAPGRRASGRDGPGRRRPGPGVQLGAGDPQGRRLLRLRHPPPRRAG